MSKVKEISVEAKKSFSFQTYTVGMVVTVEPGEDVDLIIREGQAKCRKLAQEQIAVDKNGGLKWTRNKKIC